MAMTVEEIHGIFQFSDEFFSEKADKEETLALPEYTAKRVYPQWYLDETDAEPDLASKYKMDWLFRQGRLGEACDLGESLLSRGRQKREVYEAVLVCAARIGRRGTAQRMIEHLESLGVEDSGLAIVIERSRALLDDNSNK